MPGPDILINLLGLPLVSGINLYATILVLGLGQRFGLLQGLPEQMAILAHPIVLGLAGLLYVIEFFADKIPYLDSLWDGFHTFIRPVGAGFLAAQSVAAYGLDAKLLAMLAGAVLGLGSHATKAGARLLVNTAPEPLSNSIVSIVEDLGVVALLALMYTYPWVALSLVVLLIMVMAVITPLLFRLIRFLVAGVAGAVGSSFGTHETTRSKVPDWLAAEFPGVLSTKPGIYPCYARKVSGTPRFQAGYLVVLPAGLHFAYRTLFGRRVVSLTGRPRPVCPFKRQLIFDVVAVDSGRGAALICVTKNWSPSLEAEIGVRRGAAELLTAQHR